MPTSARLRVEEVGSLAGVEQRRDEWERLLLLTPGANFFQNPDWLEIYWKHFGEGQRLRLLWLFADDRLSGLCPLVVKRAWTRVGAVRVLGFPLDHWGTHYSPLGEDPGEILQAALKHVRGRARDWDLLELSWIPGRQADTFAAAARNARLPGAIAPLEEVSAIELRGGWDPYWAARTARLRNNVRRGERRLEQWGPVELIHYRAHESCDRDPRWDLYDLCERVAARSWQAASTVGNTMTHAHVRSFLREVHSVAARRGCVDMHLLLVGGEPAAFAYNYRFQQEVYGLRMGYAPAFAEAGPGAVLLARMIEDGFLHGDQRIVLGEGDAHYKHVWRTSREVTYRFRHYPRASLSAQALRLKRWL